jgi:cyclophilin family peptidyl-prolyl cis-trans isomerase
LQTKEYKVVPDNTFIYAPSLFDSRQDFAHSQFNFDWSTYFYFKSNKKPVLVSKSKDELFKKLNDNNNSVFYINYGRNTNDLDQYIAFSRISKRSDIDTINNCFYADSADIYYYSKNKTFSVLFNTKKVEKTFVVNNETFLKLNGFVEFDVLNKNYKNDFVTIKIKSKEIDLNSIRVTNITKPGSVSIILN